jgi:hypothetical protein
MSQYPTLEKRTATRLLPARCLSSLMSVLFGRVEPVPVSVALNDELERNIEIGRDLWDGEERVAVALSARRRVWRNKVESSLETRLCWAILNEEVSCLLLLFKTPQLHVRNSYHPPKSVSQHDGFKVIHTYSHPPSLQNRTRPTKSHPSVPSSSPKSFSAHSRQAHTNYPVPLPTQSRIGSVLLKTSYTIKPYTNSHSLPPPTGMAR